MLAEVSSPGALAERPAGWALTTVRWASGIVFVSFGAGKFVNHASEASSFESYGLPWPGVFADAIGVLELLGGALLLVGLLTRLAALVLAGDMIGAIVVSGLLRGEAISLTLAPALLVAMAALAVLGPGRLALDSTVYANRRRPDRLDVA
jgi:putative oxidoreductase